MDEYYIEQFLGEGWYPVETDDVKKWAWSNREASLNFPPKHRGFSLELSGCPIESSDLIVYHKDKEIDSYELTGTLTTINIPLGVTACKIKLENTWEPRKILGTTDERALGICLHNIGHLWTYLETCDWFPSTIEMGLVGICNINPPCVMCVTRNSKNRIERPYLSEGVRDRMKPYLNYAKIVLLHGSEGEPLLSPKLFDVIGMVDTEKVYTMFATNGLLLTKEMSERLISAGLKEINFSIDAANPNTYKKIRNTDGFYTVSNNIKQLVKLKKERGVSFPNIIINTVIMKENMPGLPDFIDFVHELGLSTMQVRFLVPLEENYETNNDSFYFNYYEQRVDPDSEEFKRIMDVAKKKAMQYGINISSDNPEITALINKDIPKPKMLHNNNQVRLTLWGEILKEDLSVIQQEPRCKHPWERVLIDLNGDVRFCCHAKQILGNLNNNNFIEIWNGKAARSIRSSFLKNKFADGCRVCPLLLPQNQIWTVGTRRH